jgi:hypothetical protein
MAALLIGPTTKTNNNNSFKHFTDQQHEVTLVSNAPLFSLRTFFLKVPKFRPIVLQRVAA